MALRGIDASRHQGDPNWAAAASAGYTFAFLKATDGVAYRYVDWFHRNRLQAWQAGFVVGAYHFLLDHHSGAAQARYYVSEVNRSGGFHGVVPIVDIERELDGTTPDEVHLRDFVREFRRLVPNRDLLIYTGRWYWVGVIGNPYGADLGDLWHSEYDGINPIDLDVANGPELDRYGGWDDCLVWQHTSSGRVPGFAGSVDLNLFYGTRQRLDELAGLTTEPPPPPPEEDDVTTVSIARDDRDTAIYQVLNLETATHLVDDYAVWICAVYWAAHGNPDLQVENWDPRDIDRVCSSPGSTPAPSWVPPTPVDDIV